jgi:uncharacterized protein
MFIIRYLKNSKLPIYSVYSGSRNDTSNQINEKNKIMQKTKLNELLEFPCSFTYKVMGEAKPELVDKVVSVIQRHAPGDYTPSIKPSSKGNYHSVSITINAMHIDQVENLYKELGEIDIVRMVL